MKKTICIAVCLLLALSFVFGGCSKSQEHTYDVVLITDGGTVSDSSYNESAWEGVVQYAENTGASYRYYQPALDNGVLTEETAEKYIELAAANGAQYIILPSAAFDDVIESAALLYPDVNFIVVDGNFSTDSNFPNVMTVQFDTLQSGFLAGYMAVLSGNTQLGYFGSFLSDSSSSYGAGFVQGAAYAADELGLPVVLDYADYDDSSLTYDYSVTITANYVKTQDVEKDCFVVNVVNGSGSGTYTDGSNVTLTADPAPANMVFDHWECVSNTAGVKDSKVNLSTKKKTETNLLVEKCDCTITAVYTESAEQTYAVTVMAANGTDVYSVQNIAPGASCTVTAPAAESGMVFDHWEIDSASPESAVDDVQSATASVGVSADAPADIQLTPVYVESDVPTFDVTVVTGEGGSGESTGSGSYLTGDYVELVAAVPEEGYIFSGWSNADTDGYSAGISMGNEYAASTSFTMVNRYQSVVETMFDSGDTIVYSAGNDELGVVSEATWNYSYQLWAIGSENYQTGWTNYYTTTVKDYGSAVSQCLEAFAGGTVFTADCSNNCIWLSSVAGDYTDAYNAVYESISNGSLKLTAVDSSEDITKCYSSNLLTLNYWV